MNFRIIYSTENGVSVIIPSPDCELPINEIARKDVPAGVPYKIIDVSDIPSDRTFRSAWEAQIDEPDGYGIGTDAWNLEKLMKEYGT